MNILHIMAVGGIGGIETLLREYAVCSNQKNVFCVLFGRNQQITNEIRNAGCKVYEINPKKKSTISTIRRVVYICKSEKIDIVVVHHSSPLGHLTLSVTKSLLPYLKTVVYAHSSIYDWELKGSPKNSLKRIVFKKSFRRADRVVAISRFVKKSVLDVFGVEEKKVEVIYNGVNMDKFKDTHRNKEKIASAPRIVYVGRLIQGKGVQITLQALSKIDKSSYDGFYIVGDGEYRCELEKNVSELNLNDKVSFLGSRRDVPDILNEAQVFVHVPTFDEGFGITVAEAMACGLVCVCSESGGIPEIIDDKKNGFIVQKNDPDGLAKVLRKVIEELYSPMMTELKDEARDKSLEFSITEYSKKIDDLFNNI